MSKFQYVEGQDVDRGYLVGVSVYQATPLLSVEDSLDELRLLAKTAGIKVVGQTSQNLTQINPSTFIGAGKVQEIIEQLDYLDANVVIFDDELSPRHQRELEKKFGENVRLLDRSALILDIFAQHARTREGALQVELAQYEYRLPRLSRLWTHLARQAGGGGARGGSGGVGLRGPGETQLEVDRREISRKITKLKADLEQVRLHRSLHRDKRKKSGLPLIALVGYTNAGKSTLLNTLSDSNIYAADQLFATLDPTIRKISLANNTEVLLSDTVGFIQKLPTTLIAAFRATLEEIIEADLILHVVDVSHANANQHIEAVDDTLAEIEASNIPRILVLNKIDRLDGQIPQVDFLDTYQAVVHISAQNAQGLDELSRVILDVLEQNKVTLDILIPYQSGNDYSLLHQKGYIVEESAGELGWALKVNIPKKLQDRFMMYVPDETA
jgi:GTP-binding protein HflX